MTTTFFVTVTTSNQGRMAAESTRKGFLDTIPGTAFSYEASAVRRSTGGGSESGKPQHGPVTFTKAWGAASPELFQSFISGALLPLVVFEFVKPTSDGVDKVFQTITLTDVQVSAIRKYIDPNIAAGQDLEEISFAFQEIQISHTPIGPTTADRDHRVGP